MLRLFNHYVSRAVLVVGAAECAVLLLSVFLYVALTSNGSSSPAGVPVTTGITVLDALVFFLVTVGAMTAMGLYDSTLRASLAAVLARVMLAFCVALVMMAAVGHLYPQWVIPGNALWVPLLCSFIGVTAVRTLLPFMTDRLMTQRVLVIGAGMRATLLDRLRRKTDRRGIEIVGYIDTGDAPRAIADEKIVDARGDIAAFVRRQSIDEVVMATAAGEGPAGIRSALAPRAGRAAVAIIDVAEFFERQAGRLPLDTASTAVDGRAGARGDGVAKRVFDVFLSTLLLVIAAPAMLLVALAIWLESQGKGPILYRQTRVGKDGRRFEILKFRSMRTDAERDGTPQWARLHDSRVTRVGRCIRKTRLDELPQLVNVLRGDMSVVGPRPERPQFVDELARIIPAYDRRHRVKPGITGWAQICYPYGASVEDAKRKLEYDLYYLKNQSVFLDLAIVLQTPQVILFNQGAR